MNEIFEDVLKNWRLSNDVYKLSTQPHIVATSSPGTDAPQEALHISKLTLAAQKVARELDLLEVHKRRPRKYLERALEEYNRLKAEQCLSN